MSDDANEKRRREKQAELQAKYAAMSEKLAAHSLKLTSTPLVFEAASGPYNFGVKIFQAALCALLGAGFTQIFLTTIPLVGKALALVPGWIEWCAYTALFLYLMQLADSNEKFQVDENGLSCWIGTRWQFVSWDSIHQLTLQTIETRHGQTSKKIKISHAQGTLDYDISRIYNCGDAFVLIAQKLGDRLVHQNF